MKVTKPEISEDKWIRTMCGRCYGMCAIRVHVVNGVAIKIEGEPDSFHGSGGGICGKGVAGLQVLYDPNRLNVPLKRTNPEKGLHADPKWKEITWEEAMDTIVEKLRQVREEDPRKLMIAEFDIHNLMIPTVFGESFGTPNYTWSSISCGVPSAVRPAFSPESLTTRLSFCPLSIRKPP